MAKRSDIFWNQLRRRWHRLAAVSFARRPLRMQNPVPLISFTFDDFPRSALHTGGHILEESGARGTYYASFGLMGETAPTGEMFLAEDCDLALRRGHELGCHTFAHCDASRTPSAVFEESVVENRRALAGFAPEAEFKTLSYPIDNPRTETKERCSRHFLACRGGRQTHNIGVLDLNYLRAFFIEQSRDNPDAIRAAIDANAKARGWLIFATHDVSNTPTRYGCTPALFSEVVRYSVQSGARIQPVSAALTTVVNGADFTS